MQMLWSLAAIKEGMVEFFNSEDNSSSEEELMKKVNAVETSKGGGNPAIAHSSVQFRTLS